MRFMEAAVVVLRTFGRPMTAREIVDAAVERELLRPSGRTPVATMSAQLYRHANDGVIERVATPGPARAVRGTVRWNLVGETRGRRT